jgi:hypothetical protein
MHFLIPKLSVGISVGSGNKKWINLMKKGYQARREWSAISAKLIGAAAIRNIKEHLFLTLKGMSFELSVRAFLSHPYAL